MTKFELESMIAERTAELEDMNAQLEEMNAELEETSRQHEYPKIWRNWTWPRHIKKLGGVDGGRDLGGKQRR